MTERLDGMSRLPFILVFAEDVPAHPTQCGATRETRIDRETTDDD